MTISTSDPNGLEVTPVSTVRSSARREVRVSIVLSDRGLAVRLQTFVHEGSEWRSLGRYHVFNRELADTIDALVAAKAAIDSPPSLADQASQARRAAW